MIEIGDCVEVLGALPDDCVDAIVTDPPYGLGFMGKAWDKVGPEFHAAWSAEALRVLKPGGHLVAFGGTRTYHRLACAIEDAGFEIRDSLHWLYGSGFPKSMNVSKAIDKAAGAERRVVGVGRYAGKGRRADNAVYGKATASDNEVVTEPATPEAAQWEGFGTALKPAHEPAVLARKPLSGTVAATVLAHGTGALNIDACRTPADAALVRPAIKRGGSVAMHAGLGAGVQVEPAGRWPANVLLTDAELGDRARFFPCFRYQAKASKREREAGLEDFEAAPQDPTREAGAPGGDNPRNRGARARANNHPTVKPIELMRWLVRLVVPPGGLCLDPFAGSGTTGIACALEGVDFAGIEMSPEYAAIAEARIRHWEP